MMSTTSSPDLSLDFSSPIATPLLRKSGGRGRGLEAHQTETPPLPVMDPEIRELLARHNKSMLGKENAELGTPNGVNGPLSPFATPLLKPQHLKKIVFSKQPGSGIIGDQADTPVKPSPLSDSTGGVVNDVLRPLGISPPMTLQLKNPLGTHLLENETCDYGATPPFPSPAKTTIYMTPADYKTKAGAVFAHSMIPESPQLGGTPNIESPATTTKVLRPEVLHRSISPSAMNLAMINNDDEDDDDVLEHTITRLSVAPAPPLVRTTPSSPSPLALDTQEWTHERDSDQCTENDTPTSDAAEEIDPQETQVDSVDISKIDVVMDDAVDVTEPKLQIQTERSPPPKENVASSRPESPVASGTSAPTLPAMMIEKISQEVALVEPTEDSVTESEPESDVLPAAPSERDHDALQHLRKSILCLYDTKSTSAPVALRNFSPAFTLSQFDRLFGAESSTYVVEVLSALVNEQLLERLQVNGKDIWRRP